MAQGLRTPLSLHPPKFSARARNPCRAPWHPPTVVLFTVVGVPPPIYGAYDPQGLDIALEEPPKKSVLISTPNWARTHKTIGLKRACLMRGHGITTAADRLRKPR
jgi:hypothetical protein